MKAIVMLSGGLDSTLAARLMLEQGIELEAVNFLTVFCTCTPKGRSCLASKRAVEQLGIPLKLFDVSKEYLDVVRSPKFGYGRNLNPCIDCRIFMFKKAAQYMREVSASFLVTGEVLNERPMSQRMEAMMIIERESGLEGLILRPLSAKLLKPTIPEENGWVDRTKLLRIKGRSRRPQIALAENFGLKDYPCPAGGCRLTDPGFARRMRDLMQYQTDFGVNDVMLLKLGRHFRLKPQAKLVVGRNKEENEELSRLARRDDVILDAQHLPGPLALLRGKADESDVTISASIVASHSKQNGADPVEISIRGAEGSPTTGAVKTVPAEQKVYEPMRI